jgi:hypothetical protein
MISTFRYAFQMTFGGKKFASTKYPTPAKETRTDNPKKQQEEYPQLICSGLSQASHSGG